MSAIENMRTRLNFNGGTPQINRMNEHKLQSLKRALLYSYQSATAILADGREFRCLINPDLIKNQYDNKFLSIPFEDICLGIMVEETDPETGEVKMVEKKKLPDGKTSSAIEPTGIKCGDVITWKETNTDWLVYLQRLEETAYFRAELRRAKYEVDVNGKKYKVFAGRPSTNEIDWRNVAHKSWNDIDYTLNMYITKDENTEAYFHRFTIIKINGKPWEVQAIDNMSSDGIITMSLKEYYQNTIEEEIEKEKQENPQPGNPGVDGPSGGAPFIYGPTHVKPYDKAHYIIVDAGGGNWVVEDKKKLQIINQDEFDVDIQILSGRSGTFKLKYCREDEDDIVFNIIVDSI